MRISIRTSIALAAVTFMVALGRTAALAQPSQAEPPAVPEVPAGAVERPRSDGPGVDERPLDDPNPRGERVGADAGVPVGAADVDSSALVPAFRYIQRTDSVRLEFADLAGPLPAARTLQRLPNFTNNYCTQRTLRSGSLQVMLDRNDDYEYSGTGPFQASVTFQLTWVPSVGATVPYQPVTLTIDENNPEQAYQIEFKPADSLAVYEQADNYLVTVTGANIPAAVTRDLRLRARYFDEYAVDALDQANPATPLVEIDPIRPNNGITNTNPVTFTWDLATGCSDTFPDYQLQLLRLYNTEPGAAYTTDEGAHLKAKAAVDWSEALTVEIGSSRRELNLTIAEGSGYYIWRVRPIGNTHPGELGNHRNWGVWSAAAADGTVLDFTSPTAVDLPAYAFYYHQFDNDKTWTYARGFSEGLRVAEGITYATSTLLAEQTQTKSQTDDHVLVGQTVYDHSGRAAIGTLDAPAESGPTGAFGYMEPLMAQQKSYRAEHFDNDAVVDDPVAADDGVIQTYHSDANPDKTVSSADGYPFAQARYYGDGTGRVMEAGGPGAVLRVGGAGAGMERTARVYYSGVSSAELIHMFGDEAPSDTSVYKTITVDPNKVASVEYYSKEGQVIATCLDGQAGDTLMTDITYERPTAAVLWIRDTITGRRAVDEYEFTSNKRLSFSRPTLVNLEYRMTPAVLQATGCVDVCTTCDYEIRVIVHDVEHPENTRTYPLTVAPAECGAETQRIIQQTLTLGPGTFVIERRMRANTVNPNANTVGETYAEYFRRDAVQQLIEHIRGYDSMETVLGFLSRGSLDSLYRYLDVVPGDDTVKVIEGDCCPVRVPIIDPDCDANACAEGTPDFEQYLIDKWGATFGGNDEDDLNKYFRSGGTGQYPAGNVTYPNGRHAFNAMIDNMLAERMNNKPVYSCDVLFECWRALVDNFDHLATLDGNPANLKSGFSLLESFLDCAGRRIVSTGTSAYDATRGYLLFAYKYLHYNIGDNPDCETWAGYNATWQNDPAHIDDWNKLYTCLQAGMRQGNETDAGSEIKDDCMDGLTDLDARDDCIEAMKERIENPCKAVCDAKRDMFISATLQGFAGATPPITWEQVICIADALVEDCKTMCTLTVTTTNGHITGLGTQAEFDRIDKVYNQEPEVAPKGAGACPTGWSTYAGWTRDYRDIIIPYLNEHLNRYRADTVGAAGGLWNFKRMLRHLGIPTSILNTITDSLVMVYRTDTESRFELNEPGGCELWYHADTAFIGTAADPHPLVSHLNEYLDAVWGYVQPEVEVEPWCKERFDPTHRGVWDARYEYPADLPIRYADDVASYLSQTFAGINGSAAAQAMSDLLTAGPPDVAQNSLDGSIHAYQTWGGTDYRIAYAGLKSVASGRWLAQTHIGSYCETNGLYAAGSDPDTWLGNTYVFDMRQICGPADDPPDLTATWEAGNTLAGQLDEFFQGTYTQRIGYFIEDADHYLAFVNLLELSNGVFVFGQPSDPERACEIRFYTARDKRLSTDICETIECPAVCFRWVQPDTEVGQADTVRPETCRETAVRRITESINRQIEACAESMIRDLENAYIATCSDPANVADTLVVSYPQDYYHFTLYYYDRAGNLVRSVAPKGVVEGSTSRMTHPAHGFVTRYEYNSLGQPMWEQSPDAGEVTYWYDSKGRVRFTMSAQQKVTGAFTFLKYDALGRVTQTGRGTGGGTPGALDANVNVATFPAGGSERVSVVYSAPAPGMAYLDGTPQRNLQNRISYMATDEGARTSYSYDEHGNIEWVAQELPGFSVGGVLRRNYTRYSYDLVSGNVNRVAYNEGLIDAFHHRYTYDADNRLVKVETSRDAKLWDRDASYAYTATGELKRLELGEDKLQGMDYAYTPQGWLKAINHPALDAAKDPGGDLPTANTYPADSFAVELRYFEGDFAHTGSQYDAASATALPTTPLFDGTITGETSNIGHDMNGALWYDAMAGETYRYDVLGRIDSSRLLTRAAGGWTSTDDYLTAYTYDANGNVATLHRNAHPGTGNRLMDKQSFNYANGTNRLTDIGEDPQVVPGGFAEDIDNQGANNYTYDADGNQTKQLSNNAVAITWNNAGRVSAIDATPPGAMFSLTHRWTYDAMGNRIKKETTMRPPMGPTTVNTIYYVYDAGGVLMAIYEQQCTVTQIGPPPVPDIDVDLVTDNSDNCVSVGNILQSDADHDGIGDDCDSDIDNDGVANAYDVCPLVANPAQDSVVCAGDIDGDGLADAVDACPAIFNPPNAPDSDGNGVPDICDVPWHERYRYGTRTECTMKLAELPIYGLGRVGTCKPNVLLTDQPPTTVFTRTVGQKEYELHDHLGNVRVAISDRKMARLSGAGVPEKFYADVLDYNNYYPFGMEQPGRSLNGYTPRFGYNGMENDGTANSQYNTYFREYDARTTRWWATDPITHPWESPYAGMANNPVNFTDVLGAEVVGGPASAAPRRERGSGGGEGASKGNGDKTDPAGGQKSPYLPPLPPGVQFQSNSQFVAADATPSRELGFWDFVDIGIEAMGRFDPARAFVATMVKSAIDDGNIVYTSIADGDPRHLNGQSATRSEVGWAFVNTALNLIPIGELGAQGAKALVSGASKYLVGSRYSFITRSHYITPNLETIRIPNGAVGPIPTRGRGFQYKGGSGGGNLHPKVANVRIMEPNATQGARYSYSKAPASPNTRAQTVNPLTGRTIGKADPYWHIPLKPRPAIRIMTPAEVSVWIGVKLLKLFSDD